MSPSRGWMAGIGGCPNVGGICIGCTMPGFPDKFMPFMDEPPAVALVVDGRGPLRAVDPLAASLHESLGQPRAEMAPSWRATHDWLQTKDVCREVTKTESRKYG